MNCIASVTNCGTCGSQTSKDIRLWCSGVGVTGKLNASINREPFWENPRVDMCTEACCSCIRSGSADVEELIRRRGVGEGVAIKLLLLIGEESRQLWVIESACSFWITFSREWPKTAPVGSSTTIKNKWVDKCYYMLAICRSWYYKQT